jgi:hypothetical protein
MATLYVACTHDREGEACPGVARLFGTSSSDCCRGGACDGQCCERNNMRLLNRAHGETGNDGWSFPTGLTLLMGAISLAMGSRCKAEAPFSYSSPDRTTFVVTSDGLSSIRTPQRDIATERPVRFVRHVHSSNPLTPKIDRHASLVYKSLRSTSNTAKSLWIEHCGGSVYGIVRVVHGSVQAGEEHASSPEQIEWELACVSSRQGDCTGGQVRDRNTRIARVDVGQRHHLSLRCGRDRGQYQ